ncbi:unnamed protein product, partial [Polarella glacialis]
VIALDRSARDSAAAELCRQGLQAEVPSRLFLLSDFSWFFDARRSEICAGICADGSGTGFVE